MFLTISNRDRYSKKKTWWTCAVSDAKTPFSRDVGSRVNVLLNQQRKNYETEEESKDATWWDSARRVLKPEKKASDMLQSLEERGRGRRKRQGDAIKKREKRRLTI